MPKSKRNRAVTLSKTKKKGREHKEAIMNSIRQALEDYSSICVFSFENMRNLKFKEFREQLKSSSRFFLGSNKVMQISLGRSVADEIKPGVHKVSKCLRGDVGLFFTNLPKEEVERLFGEYEEPDFARTGSIATEKKKVKQAEIQHKLDLRLRSVPNVNLPTAALVCFGLGYPEICDPKHGVELKEGPLEQFTHEMEPFLRKQGMPVRLNKGVVELVSDFVVCEEGQPLSPESARILRLLSEKMAKFRLHLICRLTAEDFEAYRDGPDHSDIESP